MNQSTAQSSDRGIAPSDRLAICGATDVGAARANNQDTFVIADLQSGDLSNPCSRKEIPLSRHGILLLRLRWDGRCCRRRRGGADRGRRDQAAVGRCQSRGGDASRRVL